MVFDDYLFSFDAPDGTSVWDVSTGERLLHQMGTCPLRYHKGARSFLSLEDDGAFRVSKLRGLPIEREWLERNEKTVARLARGILQERAFDGLPVLAEGSRSVVAESHPVASGSLGRLAKSPGGSEGVLPIRHRGHRFI